MSLNVYKVMEADEVQDNIPELSSSQISMDSNEVHETIEVKDHLLFTCKNESKRLCYMYDFTATKTFTVSVST